MPIYFVEAEAKLFCLLLIMFFHTFRKKHPQQERKRDFVHPFLFLTVAFSLLADNAGSLFLYAGARRLCLLCVGAGAALSGYFLCRDTFSIFKKSWLYSAVCGVICVIFGFFAYQLSTFHSNFIIYLLVFLTIVVYVVRQYNWMRTDNLTKLYNRYGMEAEIRKQLQEYAEDKTDSFCLIACDLDNFKHINDTWGHREGDRALTLISVALLKVAKQFDCEVFRIGGDEFVIVTDTSEEAEAYVVVDGLKAEFDDIDFRDDFQIRMSMGVALYNGETPLDALLEKADKRMYEVKRAGKA